MTAEEVDNLSGRELNRAVAVAMGEPVGFYLEVPSETLRVFRWLRAFVAERHDEDCSPFRLSLSTGYLLKGAVWYLSVERMHEYTGEDVHLQNLSASGSTEGEAIGRALLKIVAALSPQEQQP